METYKLHIPRPCHQNWENMSPTDKGAFCAACNKEVIDFSQKTYPEIAEILNKKTGQKVCARFAPEQTQFEYEYQPVISTNSWLRRGLVGAVLSLLIAVFSANAQAPVVKQKTEAVAKKGNKKLAFKGTVIDAADKKPISGVNILMASNRAIGTTSDSLGNFKLIVEQKDCVDSLFAFSNMACEDIILKLEPGTSQTVELLKKVYELEPLVIEGEYRGNGGWEPHPVGELPLMRYTLHVVQRPDVPVDMKIRHYLGISYWD